MAGSPSRLGHAVAVLGLRSWEESNVFPRGKHLRMKLTNNRRRRLSVTYRTTIQKTAFNIHGRIERPVTSFTNEFILGICVPRTQRALIHTDALSRVHGRCRSDRYHCHNSQLSTWIIYTKIRSPQKILHDATPRRMRWFLHHHRSGPNLKKLSAVNQVTSKGSHY